MTFGACLMRDKLHTQDLPRYLLGLFGRVRQLHAAALTAAPGVNLRLDDHLAAQFFGDGSGFGGSPRDASFRHRDAEVGEDLLGLVFVNLHCVLLGRAGRSNRRSWLVVLQRRHASLCWRHDRLSPHEGQGDRPLGVLASDRVTSR